MAGRPRILSDGIVAGLLGAATVALWFLLFDGLRGQLLHTPALLAAVLLHGGTGAAVAGHIGTLTVEYTLVHVAAFVVFGLIAAALLALAEREPSLLSGLLIFFGGFEIFFVALLMYRGPVLTVTITWWSVLAANLLASAVMLAYFFLRHRALAHKLLGPSAPVVGHGIVTGMIGAMTVAVWFLIYDAATGRPLYTPVLLASVLLEGATNPAAVQVSVPLLLGYSVFHCAVFIFFGVVAATLLAGSEREPLLLLGVLLLFTTFEVFFIGFAALISEAVLPSIGWWPLLVANLLATVAMLGYLLPQHRGIGHRFRRRWQAQTAAA